MSYCPVFLHLYDIRYKNLLVEVECLAIILNWYKHLSTSWHSNNKQVHFQGPFGNPAIIQSACWYLDSVLGTHKVQLDRLQLVGAACYWIAQKLHGPMMPASRLVKCANYAFSQDRLLAAEKAVIQKLVSDTVIQNCVYHACTVSWASQRFFKIH